MNRGRACPIETAVAAFLTKHKIRFTRPESNPSDPTNLDFHLTDFDMYVEVKRFHTDRAADQLAKAPEQTTVLLLQGPNCMNDFTRLIDFIVAQRGQPL